MEPLRGPHEVLPHGHVLQLGPGPVGEVDERGHDLRRDVVDLDDVFVVVPLEKLGLDAEDHPVHVELALAAGAARYDLTTGS